MGSKLFYFLAKVDVLGQVKDKKGFCKFIGYKRKTKKKGGGEVGPTAE